MNRVVIMGRLTADPELRQTQSGIASCRFTVAVNRRFKNQQTGEYEADFISCQAWRQTAEFISRYFKKGQMIAVDGSLRTGSYTDKNHLDVTHYTTDLLVDGVEFCGSKNESSAANTSNMPAQQTTTQQAAQTDSNTEYTDLSDFEEILSDVDVPF